MRTLKLDGNSQVRVIEVADPTPAPDEVIVKTAVSVLCGSELHTYCGHGQDHGNTGHEAAGTVVALGSQVTSLKLGQRVGVSGVSGCGHCPECAAGRYTWCTEHPGFGSMHAELIRTQARTCLAMPDDVPWDAGVLLSGDGIGVPYHTSTRLRDPWIKNIAIFGAGPIGLGNIMMQSYLGRRVIAIDIVPYRLELAKKLGAAEVVDARGGEVVAQVRALTNGFGPEACLEAAGKPETFRQALAAVRTGGTVAVNGEQQKVEISPSEDLIRRDITLFGSWFYFYSEFDAMVALYQQGFPAANLITHHYPFSKVATAYTDFAAGRTGKVMLEY